MAMTKRNAPSTAATGIGAKIIKIQTKSNTESGRSQVAALGTPAKGVLVPFSRPKHQKCPPNAAKMYRILTQSDFAGLCLCAAIAETMGNQISIQGKEGR